DRLSADVAAEVDAHLDRCARCRRLVAALVRHGAHRSPLTLTAGAQIGRYPVLHRVGVGAMGAVYAARDAELDRTVALKLLHAAEGEDARKQLLREAQALARLQHPNVITLYDTGTFEERVFLSMEFISGRTLASWLAVERRAPGEIVRVFALAGRGLA